MRRAARVDENHAEIVKMLTEAGAEVTSLAAVGQGVPDLLVSFRGSWILMEVKDGKKMPSRRKLTCAQKVWQSRQNAITYVVHSPMEALEALGAMRKEISWREAMREDA